MRPATITSVTFLSAALLLSACGGGDAKKPTSTTPAAASVGVELTSGQPQYPRGTAPTIDMVLRNDGTAACKLPSSSVGAVDVVSVTRDGQPVIGTGGHEYYYGGMADVIEQDLKDVAPGASVNAPLDIAARSSSSAVLTTTKQTGADDGQLTSWPLDQPGGYRITARLVPLTGVSETCGAPSTLTSVEFEVQP